MKPPASPSDALGAVPPRDFVGARNALAAQLAQRGRAADARRVAKMRRPSPVVWALNRAAAARPRDLGALGDAVDRLRRAQLGGGDLRAATERYRIAFEPLVRGANRKLKEAGTAVSAALDRRIRSTLLTAVADRALRADLAAGRLTDEHADPGFAVLSRGPIRAPAKRPTPPAGPAPTRAPDAAEVRRVARERVRAVRETARAQRAVARRAERAALTAERRVAAMRQALAALERRSGELRAAADAARVIPGPAGSPPR
jgi:hypothetical protein